MQAESDSLPKATTILASCTFPWTTNANKSNFGWFESDTKGHEPIGSTLSPATITAANLVLIGLLGADERQEVLDDISSDGSDGAPAPLIQPTPVSGSRRFLTLDQTAGLLSSWKGHPLDFGPREKKASALLKDKARTQALKPVESWDQKLPLPVEALARQPYEGMPTAWLCLSAHFRGLYIHSGDELSCNGCGTSRASHNQGGIRNLPFYMVPNTTAVVPDAGTAWYPSKGSPEPYRISAENQRATEAYKLAEQKLITEGQFDGSSIDCRLTIKRHVALLLTAMANSATCQYDFGVDFAWMTSARRMIPTLRPSTVTGENRPQGADRCEIL